MRIATVLAFLMAAGFFITDCAGGHDATTVAVITGKYYVPETTTISFDSDGGVSSTTYPEEFHVQSADIETQDAFDIRTTRHYSASVTNGQIVTVKWRVGKWTRFKTMHSFME